MNEILFLSFFILMALVLLFAFRAGRVYLYACIASFAVLINIFVLKPFDLAGFTVYGGNILYGLIFLGTDILTEHYGKKEGLKAVKIGFMALLIYLISSSFYLHLNICQSFTDLNEIAWAGQVQGAFKTLFTPAWGIALASLTAFLISNTTDVFLFAKFKKISKGKFLWLRNNLATAISQFIDTLVFTLIVVATGFFASEVLWEIILFNYTFKLFIALLDTPFIYLSKHEFFSNPKKRQQN